MLGNLTFASPALLAAAIGLPLAYLLIRLLPPSPRIVRLPSFRLIENAVAPPPHTARPPWWLVAMRLGMLALFIAGLAGPRIEPERSPTADVRLAIVIDNGWASASQWERIAEAARQRIASEAAVTRFAILPTASAVRSVRFVDATTAKAIIEALSPQPWPGERAAIAKKIPPGARTLWISDGVEDGGANALRAAMRGGEVIAIPPIDAAFRVAGRMRSGWSGQVVGTNAATLRFVDARGARLAEEALTFVDGVATFRVALDPQARRRVAKLEVDEGSAQAVFLADATGERPRVALVAGASAAPPLESGSFYVRRALEPHAEVVATSLAVAATDPANLLIFIDVAVDPAQAAAILKRVENGAVAISFAGPRVAENGTALSPVPLRTGARALGGVLSWQSAQAFGGFAPGSPLAGLKTNPEARVARQLLASSDDGAMRWAWLADGTPIVTAARRGQGLLILVHTSADPSWSSLPITGAFEALLTRLLPLGASPDRTDIAGTKPWVLERMLGARGEWTDPPRRIEIPAADFDAAVASAKTPPGIYRSGDLRRPLNLATVLGPRFRFEPLKTDGLRPAADARRTIDIGRWLLIAASIMAIIDVLIALRLRGALAALLLFASGTAKAADVEIAYVRGGGAYVEQGIKALGTVLARRTAVTPGNPAAVDPARDPLGRYALLYWPAREVPTMSEAAAERLRSYMAVGGVVVFDFGRPIETAQGARQLLEPLGLPALAEVGPRHVLSRSFYLLPGYAGGAAWAEAGTEGANGRVSGVIIGGGDWAAIWSGEKQVPAATREMAYRFGVNAVMYALTGTYKADQVHTRALLDRLGNDRR